VLSQSIQICARSNREGRCENHIGGHEQRTGRTPKTPSLSSTEQNLGDGQLVGCPGFESDKKPLLSSEFILYPTSFCFLSEDLPKLRPEHSPSACNQNERSPPESFRSIESCLALAVSTWQTCLEARSTTRVGYTNSDVPWN
jgi:hypothetical protein